jgi:cytochrome P450 family 6
MLTGSPVDVKDTMAKFTTDVIASCAFGIDSNSLKNPDAEFRRYLRNIFDFSIMKGLAGITAFFAPSLKRILKLKIVDDITTDYIRKAVWRTVDYRSGTYVHYLSSISFRKCKKISMLKTEHYNK